MRKTWLLPVALLAGCTASMVKSAGGSASPYAPTNERSQGGLIKYSSDGASFIVNRRRESAYKQMYESCNGPYHIVAEGQRVEGSVVESSASTTGSATASTFGGSAQVSGRSSTDVTTTASNYHYWYIQYACGEKADSTAKPKP